jgi:membrane protease YdiL (CAAX protease family)
MKDPLFSKSHPFTKIIFLSFIGIVSISILFVFTFFLSKEDITSLKVLTALQHLLLFILPPIVAAYLYSPNTKKYLFINKPKTIFIGLTILIIVFAIPLINFTGVLNAKLSLPEGLSGIEKIMKEMENSAKIMTEKILRVNSIWGLLINIFIIALLPAIGEELIFRGILLRLFKEWFKNMHVAIIVSAFFFSFFIFNFMVLYHECC